MTITRVHLNHQIPGLRRHLTTDALNAIARSTQTLKIGIAEWEAEQDQATKAELDAVLTDEIRSVARELQAARNYSYIDIPQKAWAILGNSSAQWVGLNLPVHAPGETTKIKELLGSSDEGAGIGIYNQIVIDKALAGLAADDDDIHPGHWYLRTHPTFFVVPATIIGSFEDLRID
ncbi:hypothetical protein B2J88_47565 [Rhodococcus sp. SRB_17]|nr:hypothetical protein [Rhodococcus sp. SRB_17]